jgi:purine-binding chemotaxis protein CheW
MAKLERIDISQTMKNSMQLVVFLLENQKFAIDVSAVQQVIPALRITPLPDAPEIVLGVFSLWGQIIPVFNIRKRFRLPERVIEVTNQFLIAHASGRKVALVVDRVLDVQEHGVPEISAASEFLPEMDYVEGIIKTDGGLILIHDLNSFLSLGEKRLLENVLPLNTRLTLG